MPPTCCATDAPDTPSLDTAALDSAALEAPRPGTLSAMAALGSLLCAVHCLAMPLLVALAPLTAQGLALGPRAEGLLWTSALGFGLVTLGNGFRSHRTWAPLAALGAGALGIGLGHLVPHGAHVWVALGGLALAGAQVLDWRARKRVVSCCAARH